MHLELAMHDQNLFLRNDTILGVCEAIGRDFGFHPNWLRMGLAVALFFAPFVVIGGYVALALPVAFARWMFPVRSPASPIATAGPVEATTEGAQGEDQQMLPLAA